MRRVHSDSSHVLGIDVSARTVERWRSWFAPEVQPFHVDTDLRRVVGAGVPGHLPLELQDSFLLYGEEIRERVVGLDRPAFDALPPGVRASLVRHQVASGRRLVPSLRSVPSAWRPALRQSGDGHRFVWWPDTLRECGDGPLLRFVADDLLASRHVQVSPSTWERARAILPGAQGLAGTYADCSGPNCFGTVMGAAGVDDAAETWMQREPFEEWLHDATRPGGDDARPGTVLVWRDRDGLALHAAVTLGDGWALHKPSQGWMTPRKVLSVPDAKRRARQVGARLSRRLISPAWND